MLTMHLVLRKLLVREDSVIPGKYGCRSWDYTTIKHGCMSRDWEDFANRSGGL